MKNRH